MMKKISLKGLRLSSDRRHRETSPKTLSNSEVGEENSEASEQNDSPIRFSQLSNADDISVANEDPNKRKREKMGLLKNLRRKFTQSVHRKSEDVEPSIPNHIEVEECPMSSPQHQNQANSLTISVETKKTRPRSKHLFVFCDKSVQSCPTGDGLNTNLQYMSSSKISEMHSNTDNLEQDPKKEKSSCRGKDISKFHPDVSNKRSNTSNIIEGRIVSVCENGAQIRISRDSALISNEVSNRPDIYDNIEITADKHGFIRLEYPCVEPVEPWSLTQELFRLSKFGWYWGPITRHEAEDKLYNQTDGAFLVRDSSDERYLLSLSFRSEGQTLHTRIEHCNGLFSFYAQPDTEGYPSIIDLIEHSMNDSQTGIFCYSRSRSPGAPSFPVRLTKPVSRFTQVRSLKYLCRFVIRQYTRYDHIQHLPLPTSLKGWIEENQYY